jgi:hypothetical protein
LPARGAARRKKKKVFPKNDKRSFQPLFSWPLGAANAVVGAKLSFLTIFSLDGAEAWSENSLRCTFSGNRRI